MIMAVLASSKYTLKLFELSHEGPVTVITLSDLQVQVHEWSLDLCIFNS
jgi:hypothetical protein